MDIAQPHLLSLTEETQESSSRQSPTAVTELVIPVLLRTAGAIERDLAAAGRQRSTTLRVTEGFY